MLVIFCVMLSLSMPARTLEPEFVHWWLLCGRELMHLNIEFFCVAVFNADIPWGIGFSQI